ncbi:peroxisomal sarcosine oxidase-like [Mytilus trossulus]|uniref:peroxisomal sarcosine oxidase-like n=1 Tax=Mytilus trossulus TaxID=6551 RepID=UPI00300436D8
MIYDTIVVGAGIEGSATAYHLAKQGQKILQLEQFPLPHNRGSSHGQSRITRKAYGPKEHYTVMMKEAFKLWEVLERESKTTVFRQTGMLTMGSTDNIFVNGTIQSLRKHNMAMDILDSTQAKARYPMVSFPDDFRFVLDHSGGILRADKALKAFQDQFQKFGGELQDGEPMVNIIPGDIITVQTTKGSYKCRSLVLTVGPWAQRILPAIGVHAPLKPMRINVCYWKERTKGEYGADKFPVFFQIPAIDGYEVYGLPSEEYPGHVKICLHAGPEIDPDNRDAVDDKWVIDKISEYVARHFPNLVPTPSIVETCIYTMLPDEDLILDTHPSWKNIIIGAGFSGHGFKLAPVVGKVLGELAMGKSPSYDLTPCKINRFFLKSKI